MQTPIIPETALTVAEALLIGFLVGAQREAAREPDEVSPGVRDFVLVALVGAVCGLMGLPWLTVTALASVTVLLTMFHFAGGVHTGITTELAAVTTFCLAFVTAVPQQPHGSALAIGLTVTVVVVLEAKKSIHRFVRETITPAEFEDSLRFLAVVFIVFPVLPEGSFGPYGFLSPRQLWMFVILICSISFVGYFLEKFLGSRAGLRLSGLLGGMVSTTAATASLSRNYAEEPEKEPLYWQAVLFSNAVQFPRVLVLLSLVDAALAWRMAAPLAAMCVAGLGMGLAVAPRGETSPGRIALRSPFRIVPALQLAAVLAAILFVTKWAAQFGGGAVLWSSALAGSVDADSVVLSLSDMVRKGAVTSGMAEPAILLAMAGNAVVKTVIAANAGSFGFARKVAMGFAAMFGAGAAGWWLARF